MVRVGLLRVVLAALALLGGTMPVEGALTAAVTPTTVGLAVENDPAATLAAGAFASGTTVNDNGTGATVTVASSAVPLADAVTATVGTCVQCAASRLDADDGDFTRVDSTGILAQEAAFEVRMKTTVAPYSNVNGPVEVQYRGRASMEVRHTLAIKNVTSGAWENMQTLQFSTESSMSGSRAKGSYYKDASGVVTIRISGAADPVPYNLEGDWVQVRLRTDNATAGWLDTIRVETAADEVDGVVLLAGHGGLTNAARITTASIYAGATRLLHYDGGAVQEELTQSASIAAGGTQALEVRTVVTAGAAASWTVDLVLQAPEAGWRTEYSLVWSLQASP